MSLAEPHPASGASFGTGVQTAHTAVPVVAAKARLDTVRDTGQMATPEQNAARFHGGINAHRAGPPETGGLDMLLRSLPGMQAVLQTIRDVAMVDVPVLIEGEAGTGVDFAAHELHALSPRRLRPFVMVPCSGMPEAGLANQLWGHERRSVGEPSEEHPGLFESAEGGTVFLEEVRDLPHNLQIQLARLLKTHEMTPIGRSQPRRVNVRLICATRFNLVQEAAEGRFHPDLLYKVRVAQIRLPPLRERLVDIPPLTTFYLRQCRLMPDKPLPGLSDEAMGILLGYAWPGNMTELQSAIEFAALRCAGSTITTADLPVEVCSSGKTSASFAAGTGQTEKDRFQAAMAAAKGNRTLAARLLGISRATLYRRLKELGFAPRE